MVITTSPLVKTYTLQEFWDLPEPADRSKLELIKGVLYMSPPPDYTHDRLASGINSALCKAISNSGSTRGTIYVPRAAIWIDDHTYLEPDLFYVSTELEARMDPSHRTSADIVVEILSPSTASYAQRTKSDTYQAMGIRELWLVDPSSQTVEVRSFEAGITTVYGVGETLRSEVLPAIGIPLSALFS
jgi:Uma2 family endonuclease